jgi:anti-sigma factor ChrR (cupin superfamily)
LINIIFLGEVESMEINADFSERVVVNTNDVEWVSSPSRGVERKMLDRIGEEVARATTIVRFLPGAEFSEHTHSKGEEFFVLEGVFGDEHADYPAGTYVRNPAGTRHTPSCPEGCTILVKLRQFDDADQKQFFINTNDAEWQSRDKPGLSSIALHEYGEERVSLVRFEPGAAVEHDFHAGGEEVFVLSGELRDEHGIYPTGTWVRQPDGSEHSPHSNTGCTLWVKRGHLAPV